MNEEIILILYYQDMVFGTKFHLFLCIVGLLHCTHLISEFLSTLVQRHEINVFSKSELIIWAYAPSKGQITLRSVIILVNYCCKSILSEIVLSLLSLFYKQTIMKPKHQQKQKRPQQLNILEAIGYSYPKQIYQVKQRDAIIYALSMGFNADPLNEKQLKYTYEDHPQFAIFPTFCSIVTRSVSISVILSCPYMPILPNPFALLTGQRVQMYNLNMKPGKIYETQKQISGIIGKGSSVLLNYKMKTFEKKSKELAFISYFTVLLFGVKGNEQKGEGMPSIPKKPTGIPKFKISLKTALNQPLLYRLNGYKNGIHADPKIARKHNFKRPIMHGIAILEFCVKQIIQQLWDGNAKSLKEYHGRLLMPVYSGQSLELSVWVEDRRYIFEAEIVERKKVAVFGYVEKIFSEKL